MTTDDNSRNTKIQEALNAINNDTKLLAELGRIAFETGQVLERTRRAVTPEMLQGARSASEYLREHLPEMLEQLKELEEVEKELPNELQKPKYKGLTFDELLEMDDADDPNGLAAQAWEAAKQAVQKKKGPQTLTSTGAPKWLYSPNSTITNALRAIDGKGEIIKQKEGKDPAKPFDLPVLNVGKENEITAYIYAYTEGREGVEISKPFDEYSRAVMEAATSIRIDRLEKGLEPAMTAEMIYRAMIHDTTGKKVTPQQQKRVDECMYKLAGIWAEIDATAEVQARKAALDGEPITKFAIKDRLLNFKVIKVKAGGKEKEAYLLDEPILYTHDRLVNQVVKIPGRLLDIKEVDKDGNITGESIANTENRIATKLYLLRRIEVMRNDEEKAREAHAREVKKCLDANKKGANLLPRPFEAFRKQSRVIVFDTLFDAVGITAKNVKTDVKGYVFDVLDFLKAEGGPHGIAGYKKHRKSGRKGGAYSVEIEL